MTVLIARGVIACLALALLPFATRAATIYIDPSQSKNGLGSLASPHNTWNAIAFQPGNTYLQKAGTRYRGPVIVITTAATAAQPITLGSYGSGAPPVIMTSIDFDNGASYVSLQNYTINLAPYAGVIIQNGSNHITVNGLTITNSLAGVSITNGAGMNNTIENCTIYNNVQDGIAINQVNNTAGNETHISGNTVYNSGIHGIEIDGNYYIVEHNIFYSNGMNTSGISGIHLYAGGYNGDPERNSGSYNIIRYNVSHHNHDRSGGDGNGIEADQYTHYNQIYNNLTFANDGEGIEVYDSWSNTVYNNSAINNALDPGHSHGLHGNLTVGGTSTANVVNNTFNTNTLLAVQYGTYGIDVDATAAQTNNLYGGNDIAIQNKYEYYYRWAGVPGDNQTVWNTQIAPGDGDDVFGSVQISNAAGMTAANMDFAFAPADQLHLVLNGRNVTLFGWRADSGLYVIYN